MASVAALDHPRLARYSDTETGIRTFGFDTAQDSDGILYFASSALLTFDGERWKSYPVPDTYAIRRLHFGPDGRLWVAAIGELGWFERQADRGWAYHSLRPHLPPEHANLGDVWTVAADGSGTTFVTTDRILRWNGQAFTIWKKPTTSKLFSLRTQDTVFVHHLESGLYEVNASEPKTIFDRETLGPAAIIWLERRASDWLLGTSRGFFTFDGAKLTPFAPDLADCLTTTQLSSACRLPDGRIAVGTTTGGIALLHASGKIDGFLGVNDGLPSLQINSFFVSREGELWVGTGSHLVRIDLSSRTAVFDEHAGLPPQAHTAIAALGPRVVIVNAAGAYQLAPGETRFAPIESLRGRWLELKETNQGMLVSGFGGTRLWDGADTLPLYRTKADVFATSPARAQPGVFYLADGRNLVVSRPGASPRVLYANLPDFVISLAEDETGRLWLGTLAHGAWRGDPASPAPIENASNLADHGLPKLIGLTHVRASSTGGIFVAANNGAWYRAPGTPKFAPVENYFAQTVAAVSSVAPDDTVWLVNAGSVLQAPRVGRITLRDTRALWEAYSVDALTDIGAPRSIHAQQAADGHVQLWLGGTRAVLRHELNPRVSTPAPRAPLLYAFAHVEVDSPRTPIATSLPYSTHAIEFELAAPEFARRSLLRLETRVDGLDRDWKPAPRDSLLRLTGLRDGDYRLRARVVSETGVAGPETSFAFVVLPPWWRTPWATVGALVLILALAGGTYSLRVRALRRRNAELEQKVRQRTAELEAASAAKTQFVANMSHDIRNPLNGIVGLAIALEDTRLDPKQSEIVGTLRECTTYLSSLVEDVLDFASIESGRLELHPMPFSPPDLLRAVAGAMRMDATTAGATLSIEVAPDLPPHLVGDAGRIQQIVVNFVSNALKYAGGPICLSVGQPGGSAGEIEFAVTDRGPGISAADQAALFTKFTRLNHRPGGEHVPGTGLGLASCRLLADHMGGSVGVESAPGAGARFFLRLPLVVTTAPAIATPPAPLPNVSVLLVEDTDYNAWAASAVLSRLGLACERARTGAEALRLFEEKRFHVVLLDRNLPDMDGTEVARQIRALEPDGRQAVLLALTAYCTAADRALCLESGMDAFLGKPLTPEKLRRVLLDAGRRLLSAASMHVVESSPSTSKIDLSLLTFLSDRSPQKLSTHVQRFLDELEATATQVAAAIDALDYPRIGVEAHRLLGQARLIGATALAEAATHLEDAALTRDSANCAVCRSRLDLEIQAVTTAMRRDHLASPPA